METIVKKNYLQIVKKIVVNHFNVLSESYDEKSTKRENYLSAIDEIIITELLKGQRATFLDVGCGTGTRTEKYKFRLGFSVYGCDLSPGMLQKASDKTIDGLVLADMAILPIGAEVFDAVVCLFNVIGYLSSPEERMSVLQGFHHILKKGGFLFIDFMNRWHLGEGLSFRRSIFDALKIYLRSMLPSPVFRGNMFFNLPLDSQLIKGFVHGFSQGEIEKLFSESSFTVVKKFIVGYDSGGIKKKKTQGQFFYIVQKRTQK